MERRRGRGGGTLTMGLRSIASRLLWRAGLERRRDTSGDELYGRRCFSQEGEDMLLARIFEGRERGFYVDVGAHHPQRFSNTYYFYLRGWRGINIDAAPGSMKPFQTVRSGDINLEIPISDSRQVLTYYSFNEPALNTFLKEVAAERDGLDDFRIVSEQQLETRTLAEVLDEHLAPGAEIDFMSVDVEGLDYQVLKSNDWARFRPRVVLVEDLNVASLERLDESPSAQLLRREGYRPTSKTLYTLFFSRTD
ncbi:MAG: FkbM family methyltransferase [Pyrinomonadaceae bacterium]